MFEDQEIYQIEDLDFSKLMYLHELLNRCRLADMEYNYFKIRIDSIELDDIYAVGEYNEILNELIPKLPDNINAGYGYGQRDILKKLKQIQ